ncbi:MAG: hypothetical protein AAB065_01150 [Deltaproteobacteria bacterium]
MEEFEELENMLFVQMEKVKKLPYSRLALYMGGVNIESYDAKSAEGIEYEVQVESELEDEATGRLRVNVAVYEKGWKSFLPAISSFVITRDGTIAGG